ncbi:hypothetical protein Cgig2_003368 [Carnegiea gigantea]|uniref:Uncharacterized protein n=1 Tax=Carnegiea gigantea TaxID=171969 RepID=A0A9Q1Q7V7_9CARY|nr:hypothetical protein Cgig2_003368 [Carnegiea gigantea]
MFEKSGGRENGSWPIDAEGSQTVLGNAANERGCQQVYVEIRQMAVGICITVRPNAIADKLTGTKQMERKEARLCIFSLIGGTRKWDLLFPSNLKKLTRRRKSESNYIKTGFVYRGVEYILTTFFYVAPVILSKMRRRMKLSVEECGLETICGLPALGDMRCSQGIEKSDPESMKLKARRYFRPEDISGRESISFRHSMAKHFADVGSAYLGTCEVRKKARSAVFYLPGKRQAQLPHKKLIDNSMARKRKGQGHKKVRMMTLSSRKRNHEKPVGHSGYICWLWCLSEGLGNHPQVKRSSWNHPESLVFVNNCNVFLRHTISSKPIENVSVQLPIMSLHLTEAKKKLDEKVIMIYPCPGRWIFIMGANHVRFLRMNNLTKITSGILVSFTRTDLSLNLNPGFSSGDGLSELRVTLDSSNQFPAVGVQRSGAPFRSNYVMRILWGSPSCLQMELLKATMEVRCCCFLVLFFACTTRLCFLIVPDPSYPFGSTKNEPDRVSKDDPRTVDLVPCACRTQQKAQPWKGLFWKVGWGGNFPPPLLTHSQWDKVGMGAFNPEQDRNSSHVS